jgi:hypothetical protein
MGEGLAIQGFDALDGIVSTNEILKISGENGNIFTIADNLSANATVTLGHDFQTAIHKEIKEYLQHNFEIDMFRWKDDDESITVQVSLDGKVLSEKTFKLTA